MTTTTTEPTTARSVEFKLDEKAYGLLQIMANHDGYSDVNESVKALAAGEVHAFLHALDEDATLQLFGITPRTTVEGKQ